MPRHINKTSFKKGNIPWNKGIKGIHLSKKTEFSKGNIPANYLGEKAGKNAKHGWMIRRYGNPQEYENC